MICSTASQICSHSSCSHREPGQPSTQPQEAGNARKTRKTNTCIVALRQLNPENSPSCKTALDQGSGNPLAECVLRSASWSKRREAACPSILLSIHPSLPASHTRPTTLQAIFHLTNKPCPVFPHKGCLRHKQFLPYKLPVGAELIWSQWELLSNFLKGMKPGA